jgi:hypothetical protein
VKKKCGAIVIVVIVIVVAVVVVVVVVVVVEVGHAHLFSLSLWVDKRSTSFLWFGLFKEGPPGLAGTRGAAEKASGWEHTIASRESIAPYDMYSKRIRVGIHNCKQRFR